MNVTLYAPVLSGTVTAPTSKSLLHRALILSAFADAPTRVFANTVSEDISATVDVLSALGAKITYRDKIFSVVPASYLPASIEVNCQGSASTLRFFIPIVAALGVSARFHTSGNLNIRPIYPIVDCLSPFGVLVKSEDNCVSVTGKLNAGHYQISSSLSSQFASGLLLSLSLLGKASTLSLSDNPVSAPYVQMTLSVLEKFGVAVEGAPDLFHIHKSKITSPDYYQTEGDYSSAAYFLVGGAIGHKPISVSGITENSYQGDAAIISFLRLFGANVSQTKKQITVNGGALVGQDVDLKNNPDLFPPLAVLAACAKGETKFYGVDRLRFKESDRLLSVGRMLAAFGIKTSYENDVFTVYGGFVHGGNVDAFSDHRIAMSAATLALATIEPVIIVGAECVKKSYPRFFEDYRKLSKTEAKSCLFLSERI